MRRDNSRGPADTAGTLGAGPSKGQSLAPARPLPYLLAESPDDPG
jgi:hypothetical protein